MKIKCPACSKVLAIPDSAAGKVVKCPCGKQLRAPGGPASQNPAGAPAANRGAASGPAPRPSAPRPSAARPSAATRSNPGAGDFDPAIFDELTDQDLRPVKGVTNPYHPPAASAPGGSKLLNQYAPPTGGAGQGRREIAGVGSRILGAILDGLFVNLFVGIGIGIAFVIFSSAGENPSNAAVISALVIVVIAALIPTVINAVLISKSGQSLGKKIAGTRMIDEKTGVPAGFVQGYLIRSIAFGCLTQLPFIGFIIAIADIIYLFMDNHQTLHDKLAKTIVVTA